MWKSETDKKNLRPAWDLFLFTQFLCDIYARERARLWVRCLVHKINGNAKRSIIHKWRRCCRHFHTRLQRYINDFIEPTHLKMCSNWRRINKYTWSSVVIAYILHTLLCRDTHKHLTLNWCVRDSWHKNATKKARQDMRTSAEANNLQTKKCSNNEMKTI